MTAFHTLIVPFLGIGVLQGILLSYILFSHQKGNKRVNRLLALVMFIYATTVSTNFLMFSGFYKIIPHYALVSYPLERLIGPLFYFFSMYIIYPKRVFKWYDVLHLLPMVFLVYMVFPFYTLPSVEKIGAIEAIWFGGHLISLKNFTFYIITKLHTIVYILVALLFLRKSIRKVEKYSSNTLINFLDRLRKFTNAFLFFLLTAAVTITICYYTDILFLRTEVVVDLISTFVIHYIVFIMIRQPDKFFFTFNLEKLKQNEEKPVQQQGVSIVVLELLMQKEKPYLDSDLKIHHLAAMLEVTPHFISKLLNQEQHINFHTFINNYRIAEFKKRVDSKEYYHLTLLGIALGAGFNSKSSFHRIFKKHTQMTPSEYLKSKEVSISNLETSE